MVVNSLSSAARIQTQKQRQQEQKKNEEEGSLYIISFNIIFFYIIFFDIYFFFRHRFNEQAYYSVSMNIVECQLSKEVVVQRHFDDNTAKRYEDSLDLHKI